MTATRTALLGTAFVAVLTGALFLASFAFAEEGVSTDAVSATTVSGPPTTPSPSVGQGMGQGSGLQALIEKHRTMLAELRARKGSGVENGVKAGRMDWGVRSLKNVDASCMQTAVDTREVAVQTAHSKAATAVDTALKARQKALYDAWGVTDVEDRATAMKSAWDAWKKAHKDAFMTLRKERDAAWKTFRDTARATCKVEVPKEEAVARDASGSVAL